MKPSYARLVRLGSADKAQPDGEQHFATCARTASTLSRIGQSDLVMSSIEHTMAHGSRYSLPMSQNTRKAIGNRIRELRKSQKLSQQKLALMVNVERSYLAKIEGGKRNPSSNA